MTKVTEIRLNKDKSELKVSFEDGLSDIFSSELLRVESPSAEVQGHSPNPVSYTHLTLPTILLV